MGVPVANAAPETTVVLAEAALFAKPLAVSADDRLVFEVANELRTVRADGTEPRTLATTAVKFHGITPDDRIQRSRPGACEGTSSTATACRVQVPAEAHAGEGPA
ncbi:MAG TPA: hypothetical protein VFD36_09105 [Kofleriaceae bacterium]|nr:hypothetical protein [Kofleriaceae bacterium]